MQLKQSAQTHTHIYIYAPENSTEMVKLSEQMEELASSLTPKVNEIEAIDSLTTNDKNTLSPTQRGTGVTYCFYCNQNKAMRGGGHQNNVQTRYFYPKRDGQRNVGPRMGGNMYDNRNNG
jgi:hypothetical protein